MRILNIKTKSGYTCSVDVNFVTLFYMVVAFVLGFITGYWVIG